jgi:hypothetical protein
MSKAGTQCGASFWPGLKSVLSLLSHFLGLLDYFRFFGPRYMLVVHVMKRISSCEDGTHLSTHPCMRASIHLSIHMSICSSIQFSE